MPNIQNVGEFRKAIRSGPYAWPGGYDVFFITSDGAVLCHTCANDERTNVIWSIANRVNDGWRVVGVDASCNVDSFTSCEHCNRILHDDESGHGPVDAFGSDPDDAADFQADEETGTDWEGVYGRHFQPDE